MLKLSLSVVLAALALAAPAQAANVKHFKPSPNRVKTWVSPKRYKNNKQVTFSIVVRGREVDGRGEAAGPCRYTLFVKRLALKLDACAQSRRGRSRLRISYIGKTGFTLRYHFD